jgi:ERCC4-type nuclease
LFYAAEKCAQFKDYIPKWNNIRKEVRNPAKVYLLGIPGVSGTRANWICKELHLMGLSSLLGLTKEKLMSVKGIGNNTANTILKYL